ncbi:MAG: DUF4430 domain-containing protein [Clostridiales bacterium]|nr:DUF4430 domain-containing protein [Clostridiales bacterium]
MEPRRWKKIAFIFCVSALLIFAFWYGGDAAGLQGFSLSGEQTAEQEMESVVGQNKTTVNNENSSSDEDTKDSKEKKNAFEQFFMHITKKSSSKDTSKKSAQNNKKAQKNANRAVDKAQKKNSNKKKILKTDNASEKKTDSAVSEEPSNGQTDTNKNTASDSNDSNSPNSNNDSESTTQNPGNESNIDKSTTDGKDSGTGKDTIKCTISISCATLLNHLDTLSNAKKKQVPKDGIILKPVSVEVKKGGTVFDVLQSVAKDNKIHLEYSFTPAFKSYYIEGIHNLYEFDCGELSGWMYSVNGEFPGVGCSAYTVGDGDIINWVYTCDLGKDVGGYFEE